MRPPARAKQRRVTGSAAHVEYKVIGRYMETDKYLTGIIWVPAILTFVYQANPSRIIDVWNIWAKNSDVIFL